MAPIAETPLEVALEAPLEDHQKEAPAPQGEMAKTTPSAMVASYKMANPTPSPIGTC